MQMLVKTTALALLLASAALPALAQETRLRSVRVSAPEVTKTATFYQQTFGLKEVRKVERDGAPYEIIMNSGPDAANNPGGAPNLVVILRAPTAPPPGVSNLVFGVKDIDAVVAKATAAGGTLSRPVTVSKTSGSKIGFVKDPGGNEIELIEEKR
jgi:predicted enzyme related to lactoylglutathione lyase